MTSWPSLASLTVKLECSYGKFTSFCFLLIIVRYTVSRLVLDCTQWSCQLVWPTSEPIRQRTFTFFITPATGILLVFFLHSSSFWTILLHLGSRVTLPPHIRSQFTVPCPFPWEVTSLNSQFGRQRQWWHIPSPNGIGDHSFSVSHW